MLWDTRVFAHASQHIQTWLVFSANCTETFLLSHACIYWLEIKCGLQQAPTTTDTFLKPALDTPIASRLVLSMKVEK